MLQNIEDIEANSRWMLKNIEDIEAWMPDKSDPCVRVSLESRVLVACREVKRPRPLRVGRLAYTVHNR